jgi:PST family polysaccharide transporter
MLGRRAFAVLIGLLTAVVMPHFLDPTAYGLSTMAALVFTLGEMFKDFGLGAALLRKGQIDSDEMTFLFWFNIGMTAIISLAIAATSPLAAMFFHQPAVRAVILVSLIGFVLSGGALQHRGLLNRNLQFAHLALIDSLSLAVQFATTLALAIIGFGVWAIVAGNILYSASNALLCVFLSRWMPGKPKLIKELRAILTFGANTSVYSIALFFSTNITPILIANTQSVASVGQYNRANAFLQLPLNNWVDPIAQATLPVLARLRPFPDIYRETYLTLLRRLNLVVMPASAFLLCAARPVVETVLGGRWSQAGELLAILSPAVGVLGLGYSVSDLFITQDRSAELRTLGLAEAVVRIGAVLAGVQFGIYSAAAAYSAATLIVVSARIYVASRKGPVDLGDHLKTMLPALPPSAGVILGCLVGILLSNRYQLATLHQAIVISALGLGLGLIAMVVFGVSRRALLDLGKSMKPKMFSEA